MMPFCHQSWRGINWRDVCCVRWERSCLFHPRPIWSAKHFDWLVPTRISFFFLMILFVFLFACIFFSFLHCALAKLQISWKFTGLEKLQRWDVRWLSGTLVSRWGCWKGKKRGENERKTFWVISALTTAATIYIRPGFIIIAYTFSWSLIFIYIYFASFLSVCVCLPMSKKKEKLSAQLEMTGNSFPILISNFFFRG